jgi:hypothetical protein
MGVEAPGTPEDSGKRRWWPGKTPEVTISGAPIEPRRPADDGSDSIIGIASDRKEIPKTASGSGISEVDVTRPEEDEGPEVSLERANAILDEVRGETGAPQVEPVEPVGPVEPVEHPEVREGAEPSEAVTEYPKKQAEQVREAISRIGDAARWLAEAAGRLENVTELVRSFELDVPYLVERVADLLSGDEATKRQVAAEMVAKLQIMRSEVRQKMEMDELDSTGHDEDQGQQQDAGASGGSSRSKAARSGFKRVLTSIKNAETQLWKLISGLVTPKEWTLRGEMGLPFMGKAGVEIKFGP